MHEDTWDSDDEKDPELSWAVCSAAGDVSGAEAGLKAMIADMATIPGSVVSAGKVPGMRAVHSLFFSGRALLLGECYPWHASTVAGTSSQW